MSTYDDERDCSISGDHARWFAAGIGLGLLVGAAMGLLMAPKSGRETREQLKGYATDFGEKARTTARDLGSKASTTYQTVREKSRHAADEIKTRAVSTAKTVGEKISTTRKGVSEAIEAGKEGYRRKVDELSHVDGDESEIEDVN